MSAAKAPPIDRRRGSDRRRIDQGPPRGRDRRVGLEPRKPEVIEVDMTDSDWARLQDGAVPLPPKE